VSRESVGNSPNPRTSGALKETTAWLRIVGEEHDNKPETFLVDSRMHRTEMWRAKK
jgi:hypothetical protein